MNVEIVTIGDELLLGFTVDLNAAHIARELAAAGIRIVRRATVGDSADDIASAVQDALGIMAECYQKLGLKDLQGNVEQVYLTNYQQPSAPGADKKAWWKFW